MEVERKHRRTVHYKEGLRISVSPQQRFDEHMNQNELTLECLAAKKSCNFTARDKQINRNIRSGLALFYLRHRCSLRFN